MRHYPVFLDPARLRALVVGAGAVGLRKIGTLLDCGAAHVLALDTAPPSPELQGLLARPGLEFARRPFAPGDLDGRTLAFACTGDPGVNAQVAGAARERGVPVNVADAPELGTFIVPATVESGALTVAFSTGGASPALARRIGEEMRGHFGPAYGLFLTLMERMRPQVLALGLGTPANTELFRALVACGLLEALGRADRDGAAALLAELLPGPLVPKIGELLDGLC
ncbi:bifunctional precorrin-2 dehydrogenase/sirohydrochlorin ferrochelatase [Desulfocurvus sp.]|jgi:precorrin-2 dehydrogenase/sirohydrochlorin ferrochelatase|uniref:precorrin-2 dehydrogenase/sirohydrochlorin ferrochelatase family protein n=1 Tax=Desulfocurvus sp. TaxID=2871698 RepID=UPI0025BE8E6F|nr:bifunctional precorrin-2 dehydrogenase/sirohydrochlorin ferrochelatase [Desulfocurvus sp.]MCK9239618.1 bifunctional precorrin-2 dehydrogenase/sirohydrochlorin ferrochelatase [Desulfocurvus sp.]